MLYGWTENTFELTEEQRDRADAAFQAISAELAAQNPEAFIFDHPPYDGTDDQGRMVIYKEIEVVE